MKLQNSLYHIVSKEEVEAPVCHDMLDQGRVWSCMLDQGQVWRCIQLNADHVIFQAHFPGEPITPGVCIIQIAKELLEDVVGEQLLICAVKNVKFLRVISPVEMPQITYVFENIATDDTTKTVKVSTLVKCGDTPLAKLSFTCKPS